MMDKFIRYAPPALLALLVLWGGYGLLYYLQVPVHQAVFLSDTDRQAVTMSCNADAVLCRGFASIIPTISHFFTWLGPLSTYVALSAALFIIIAGSVVLWRGERRLRFTLSPLKIALLTLGLLWLLFTALSLESFEDRPFRQIIEPTTQVYNVGGQALDALRDNFLDLQNRGCLRAEGVAQNGMNVFTLKASCIQGAFFTRVLPQVAFMVLLFLAFLSLGRTLLGLLRVRAPTAVSEAALSAGLGACAYVVLLWALAVGHVLTMTAGWIVLFVPLLLCYRSLLYWLRVARGHQWTVDVPFWSLKPVLTWLLLSYIVLNFLNVLRPFPIGWDDLGSYLNRPRLMVSYGHFISTMSPFQWEYLTSLGFLLFGYDSTFGAVLSLLINWLAGVLAVLAVFAFTRTFRGRGGMISALTYYTLPLVGHFSFADMKVDNAVFTMGALSLFALFLGLFPRPAEGEEGQPRRDLSWIALAGVFGAFAFAMKSTAIMVIFGGLAVLLGATLHWSAFLAVVLFAWGLFSRQGVFSLADVLRRAGVEDAQISPALVSVPLFIVAGAVLAWALWAHRARAGLLARRVAVFIVALGISAAPWLLHNNLRHGTLLSFELAAPNMLSTSFDATGRDPSADRQVPLELRANPDHPFCKATGAKEELDRYWGYSQGWGHYLTLPWRAVMNIDATGYYVTTSPALLLFPLLLLLPLFWRREGRWFRWLTLCTGFIIVEWMFLANGIPWYGIGMFLGLAIGLELLAAEAPGRSGRWIAGLLVGAGIFLSLSQRLWQYDMQKNLFEYPLGKVSAEAMRERTIPHYDDIRDVLDSRRQTMPDRPFVFRVGTFIPYFIPRNPEIIALTDNQLDTFNCWYQERDAELTLQRLQALGFNSVIFDTNTATIERDQNGSLHQKVNAFVEFLNRADLGLQVVVNDPDGGIAYILLP